MKASSFSGASKGYKSTSKGLPDGMRYPTSSGTAKTGKVVVKKAKKYLKTLRPSGSGPGSGTVPGGGGGGSKTPAPAPVTTAAPAPAATQVPWKWQPSGDYMDARNRLAAEYAKAGIGRSGMYASAQARAEVMDKERQVRDENTMRNMMLNYSSQLYNTEWARYIQELQVRGNDTGLRKPEDFAYMPWLANFNPSDPLGLAPGTTPAGTGSVGDAPPGELLRRYEPNLGATLASRNADRDYGLNRERLAMQREQLDMAKAEKEQANSLDGKFAAALEIIAGNRAQDATDPKLSHDVSAPSVALKAVSGGLGLDLISMAKDTNPDPYTRTKARALITMAYDQSSEGKYKGMGANYWTAAVKKAVAGSEFKMPEAGSTPGILSTFGNSQAQGASALWHDISSLLFGSNTSSDTAFDRARIQRQIAMGMTPDNGIFSSSNVHNPSAWSKFVK